MATTPLTLGNIMWEAILGNQPCLKIKVLTLISGDTHRVINPHVLPRTERMVGSSQNLKGDFDRFGKPYSESYVKKYGIPKSQVGKPKHVCDALADAMEETVQSLAAKPEPFYLQLHAYAVHGPVQSRPDLKEAAIKHLEAKNSKQATWLVSLQEWMRFWEDCSLH